MKEYEMKPRRWPERSSIGPLGVVWLCGVMALVAAAAIAFECDDAIELTPKHDVAFALCWIPAGLVALLTALVIFMQSEGRLVLQNLAASLLVALIALGSTYCLTSTLVKMAEMHADFPPDRTRTYTAEVPLLQARQSSSKGRTYQSVVTMPPSAELSISREDYDFMNTHRLASDPSISANIVSNGYFCARLTLQQSGKALRIPNGRIHELPPGTIVICPQAPVPHIAS